MEHQVAFFNNANQIIFDLNNMINYQFFNNYIKETHYDKYNDKKNIVLNYENYVIVVDVLTYNKINVTKFSSY